MSYVFSIGQTVRVTDTSSPHLNKVGTVANVIPEGVTQSEPPTPYGEIDQVSFPGVKGTVSFLPTQLELVS